MKKQFLIQITVPRCPLCQHIMPLNYGRKDMYYLCRRCDIKYDIVGEGQSSHEFLVEAEVKE